MTVAEYLASLPPERRSAVAAVRKAIVANLDRDFEEGIQYGMIGYFVPHRVFAPGYHCDPKQPLPFAGLASQKGHITLYLMGLYMGPANGKASALRQWFETAWKKSGKKLDMGKACVRFKTIDDVPLDVIAEVFRRQTARAYIDLYVSSLGARGVRANDAKSRKRSGPPRRAATQKQSAHSARTKRRPSH